MSRDDFRERVRDLVVELAATGQTGMGFPEEYGGGGDIGASVAAFETLAFGDLSVLVKVGVQFGLFGGAILQLGTKAHHDAYLADLVTGRADGLLRDDRDRPRLQRARSAPPRRTTPRPRSSSSHARRPVAQGLHRQRRAARRAGGRLRPARGRRGVATACTPSSSRSATTASVLPGRPDRGRGEKMGLNGVDNGRIWFDGVRVPRGQPARPVRRRHRRRALREPDREPQPALLHDARHPRPGPRLRRRRRHQRRQGGARRSRRSTPLAGASSRRPPRRTEELLLDYGLHQRRLLPLLARTYALHFAQEVVAGQLHDVFSGRDRRRARRRELESRAAGTKALGTWHATRTIQACREACGGRATSSATGSPRSRPTPTSSPPSRATTTCCSSSWPRGC